MLSKTLIQLSAHGWGGILPVSCLAWGNPAVESIGSKVGLMVNPKRAHTKGHPPGLLMLVALSPQQATANPRPTGDPLTLAGRPGSVSCGALLPSLGSWCAQEFVCAHQEWNLFHPVLWKSCNQIPLAFKVWFPEDSQSLCQIPRLGSLMWGLRTFETVGELLWYYHSPVVSCRPSGYGIWFYHDCTPPTVLLRLLLYLWMWGIFFWWIQHPPVVGHSTTSCPEFSLLELLWQTTPIIPLGFLNPLKCL